MNYERGTQEVLFKVYVVSYVCQITLNMIYTGIHIFTLFLRFQYLKVHSLVHVMLSYDKEIVFEQERHNVHIVLGIEF